MLEPLTRQGVTGGLEPVPPRRRPAGFRSPGSWPPCAICHGHVRMGALAVDDPGGRVPDPGPWPL